MQKQLPLEKKKNLTSPRPKKKSPFVAILTEEANEEGSFETKDDKFQYLSRTLPVRNKMRYEKLSAGEIINKFPVIKEHEGELLYYEFDLLDVAMESIENFDSLETKIINKLNFYGFITNSKCIFV